MRCQTTHASPSVAGEHKAKATRQQPEEISWRAARCNKVGHMGRATWRPIPMRGPQANIQKAQASHICKRSGEPAFASARHLAKRHFYIVVARPAGSDGDSSALSLPLRVGTGYSSTSFAPQYAPLL